MYHSDIMPPDAPARTLGFMLLDGFALMAYASVVEPYRAANVLAGRTLYRWAHISLDGRPSHASNGATIIADRAVGEALICDTLFVFAGGDPTTFHHPGAFAWLRQLAARGTVIGGISAGPYILARAGLLDGYQATIHWEHRFAFLDEFPASTLLPGLYVIDRRRVTCAGGMAGMDLAIDLIEREQGPGLAAEVSEWFIRSTPRPADKPQRPGLRERYAIRNERLLTALARMEANVEQPASRAEVAAAAGVSTRQLERLFRHHLSATFSQTYMKIRLKQAEHLLRTTTLSVTAVSVLSGFESASHFSNRFKREFGVPPSVLR